MASFSCSALMSLSERSLVGRTRTVAAGHVLSHPPLGGCTTGAIGLPNPNQRRVVKTSGFLHPSYIYRYTARVPREGEGMTWMRQPSRQGIALFSVRMEFWRDTPHQHVRLFFVYPWLESSSVRSKVF